MVMAQKRHGKRPAHIHFLIAAPGYRELVTALYLAGDEHLEDDVVFGASGDLVVEVKASDPASPVKGVPSIHFDFSLARETEADRRAGRVGADPGQVTAGNGKGPTGPYGAPPPEMLAAEQGEEGRHPGRPVPQVKCRPRACPEDPSRRILPSMFYKPHAAQSWQLVCRGRSSGPTRGIPASGELDPRDKPEDDKPRSVQAGSRT